VAAGKLHISYHGAEDLLAQIVELSTSAATIPHSGKYQGNQ
jgi:hypothetical protein